MENLLEKIHDLNNLIREGKPLDGFEKYYHDDVIMQENESAPTVGKAANRTRETEFFNSVTELRTAQPLKVAGAGNVTMVEWHFNYSHKEWGVKNYKQVSVQEWSGGKIIHEKFYYA